MKKNIFDDVAKDEILERCKKLTEQSERQWGSLTSAEMLRHCSDALSATLAGYNSALPDTLKQKVLKFLMLNVIPRFPKGAKTPRHLDVKYNNIATLGLQSEQVGFEEKVNSFVSHKGKINATHPYFGNLTNKQWGIVTWMHIDHHFRQFGV